MWEDSVEAKLQLTQAINMQSIKKNTQIGNCIVNRCNEEWSSLDKTEDPAIRYCQKCKVNVYYCSTASQLVQYEIDGKHVAFDLREFGAIEIQRLVQYLADYRLFRGTSSGFERALEHNLILPSYWHADIFRKLIDGALDIALDAFGNLVIDTFQPRGDSLSACRYVIEPWENGLQCKRWLEGIWSTVDDISVGMVVDWGGRTRFKCISIRFAVADVWFQAFPQDDFPLCVFVRSIPPEVVNNVGRMKSHQLALLQWVAKDSRAYEMLHSVPILLWLLYDARRRSESDNDFIHKEEVLDLKRKEIFELIFGWGTKSAIKVLSRVKLELGAEPEMTRIREFFAVSENLNYVRHLQSISVNLVKLVQDYGAGVKSVFYRQFFSNNCRRSWRALFSDPGIWSTIEDYERLRSDSRSMIRTLGLGQPALSKWRRLGEVGSLQKIREFHDKLVKKSNLQEAQKRGQQLSEQLGEYPLPPLPGNDQIQPVTSYEQLVEEGQMMDHCVATYAESIAKRTSFVYRVLAPERATLELTRPDWSDWDISQLNLSGNQSASAETYQVVNEWLDRDGSEDVIKISPEGKNHKYLTRQESQEQHYSHLL